MKPGDAFTDEELKEIDDLLGDALIRAEEMLYHPKKDMPYYEGLVRRVRSYLGIKEAEES